MNEKLVIRVLFYLSYFTYVIHWQRLTFSPLHSSAAQFKILNSKIKVNTNNVIVKLWYAGKLQSIKYHLLGASLRVISMIYYTEGNQELDISILGRKFNSIIPVEHLYLQQNL